MKTEYAVYYCYSRLWRENGVSGELAELPAEIALVWLVRVC